MRTTNPRQMMTFLASRMMVSLWLLAAAVLLVGSGCSGGAPEPAATTTAVPSATPSPLPSPTATVPPTETTTPTMTPTPEPLTAADIFELVSPSVAHVSSGMFYGSGILLDGGYVLTNAHVVWPQQDAHLEFPNGDEFSEVPVVGVDLFADLALLGPIDTELPPIAFGEEVEMKVGERILLIGYPGTGAKSPVPTLTETLLSRTHKHPQLGLTLLQVDAPIAGGQSGGIALSERGQALGMTGNSITEAQFGLITSRADIESRFEGMLKATDESDSGNRGPAAREANTRHVFRLLSDIDQEVFVVDVEAGDTLELAVSSENDAALAVTNFTKSDFNIADNLTAGEEKLKVEILEPGIHYVVVEQSSSQPGVFTLTSSVPLTPYNDPDDNASILQVDTYAGVLDFPGDIDRVTIALGADATTNIRVSSLLVDPLVLVMPALEGWESAVADDDSGGGIFGTDAELTYHAASADSYLLLVFDPTEVGGMGGYVLASQEPYEGAPTPLAPLPTPTPIDSEFGDMALYESAIFPFSMQYPAAYDDGSGTELCADYTACFVDPAAGNILGIREAELDPSQVTGTFEETTDYMVSVMSSLLQAELVSREVTTTAQNDPAIIYTLVTPIENLNIKLFLTSWDDRALFMAAYMYDDPATEPLVDYVFSTYQDMD